MLFLKPQFIETEVLTILSYLIGNLRGAVCSKHFGIDRLLKSSQTVGNFNMLKFHSRC